MNSILQNLCSIHIVGHTALSEARDDELWRNVILSNLIPLSKQCFRWFSYVSIGWC